MDRINFPDKSGQRFGKTELKYLQDSVTRELFARAIRQSSPGIIAQHNPITPTSPLAVTVDSVASEFVIAPGSCLLDSGELLILDSELRVALPTDSREYLLVLTASDAYFNDQITANEQTIQTLVRTDPSVSLIALAQYSSYASNSEFLGFYSRAAGLSLTHEILTLRRWSSAADWVHRGQTGSGLVTSSNPHGTTIFDMALNSSTEFWPALDNDGLLVAGTSTDSPKVRGRLVREIININQWEDLDGVSVARLRYQPLHVVSATLNATKKKPLVLLPITPYIGRLATTEEWARTIAIFGSATTSVEVIYYVAAALNFYVSASNPYELLSLEAQASDILVIGGQRLAMASSYSFDLSDRADFACQYAIRASQSSGVYLYPRVAIKAAELADLASPAEYNLKLAYPGELLVILANTTPQAGLSVKVLISGKGVAGQEVSEQVVFNGTWEQDLHSNYRMTSTKFSEIVSLQVISANSDIRSVLQVLAVGDANYASLASFHLTQTGIEFLNDERDILPAPLANRPAKDYLWSEYFNNPKHADLNGGALYTGAALPPASSWEQDLPSRYLKGVYISAPIKLGTYDDSPTFAIRLDADGPIGPDFYLQAYRYNASNGSLTTLSLSRFADGYGYSVYDSSLFSYANTAIVIAISTEGQTKLKAIHFDGSYFLPPV